ncbi:membrane-associated protein, putative [Bodo saltans]|uniref:Membrane-associated protein, putative n=1 Tax=Bodo saltans TaxID=75058 RepID=A0A0S4JV74_BODSA|nr:membrane-associated protein, putative [Bodo saltans]|eukprot:CUG92480.1 membrane-associated protein, putative [Bodo saltans]
MPVVVLLAVAASLGILHLRRVRKMARLEREAHQSLVALQQVLITSADDELLEEQGLWQDVNAQDPTRAGSFLMNESSSNRGSNQHADAEVIRSTQLAANNMMLHTVPKKKVRNHVGKAEVFGNASMILIFVFYQTILTQSILAANNMMLHTVPKKKVRNHVPFRQVFGNASMILIFVFYQTILTQSIQTFNCVTLLIGRSGNTSSLTVLDVDVLVTCSGEAYENGLAIAMYGVFIYAIFLPLFTMTFVLHQARNIGWTATYHQFSFLIRGFRLKYWYWEFVIVFRKTGLRLLIATVNDSTLQALLGIWFLTALFVLQTYTQPYVLALHNHADQLSIMTALITLNIGLAFSTFSDSCNIVCGVFSVLLVVCNIAVIVFLAVQLGWGFYLRLVEEFGIDTADGSRRISMRNLKNILFVLLKRQHQMSPSFRTYAPRPLNRALAKSVLGRDAGTDSDDDGKEEGEEDDTVTQPSGSVTGTYQPPPLLQNQRDSDADESEEKPADEIIDPYQAFPLDHASEGSTTTNTSDEVEMQAIHPHLRRGSTMGPPRQDYSFLHVTVPQDESPRIRGGEEGGEALESDPLNLFGRRR